MKILYLARHFKSDNDDEGAIACALRLLGHDVVYWHQEKAAILPRDCFGADLVLVHHFHQVDLLQALEPPKAFWIFDRIDIKCPSLAARSLARKMWVGKLLAAVDYGFLTDGDFVDEDVTGKCHWLMQGADERIVGIFPPDGYPSKLLYAGTFNHGLLRAAMLNDLMERYGRDLRIFTSFNVIYRERFAAAVRSAGIVIGPCYPVTDRYWSNRAYLISGFGGFLLHMRSRGLFEHYAPGEHMAYYDDVEEVPDLIEFYLQRPKLREEMAMAALEQTKRRHLYRHRVEKLLEIVRGTGKTVEPRVGPGLLENANRGGSP